MRSLFALLMLLSVAAVGCDKPEYESCRQLCWRYAELKYWDDFEKNTAAMSAPDKAEARVEYEKQWNEKKNLELDPGRENCVTGCRQGGKNSDVACVMAAKTFTEVKACKLGER